MREFNDDPAGDSMSCMALQCMIACWGCPTIALILSGNTSLNNGERSGNSIGTSLCIGCDALHDKL